MTLARLKAMVETSGIYFTQRIIERKFEVGSEIRNVEDTVMKMLFHHSSFALNPLLYNVLEFQITVMSAVFEHPSIFSLKLEIVQGIRNIAGTHNNLMKSSENDWIYEYSDFSMIDAQGNYMDSIDLWADQSAIKKLYVHKDTTCYTDVYDVYAWLYRKRGVGTHSILNVSHSSMFLNLWTWPLPMLSKDLKNYVSFYYFSELDPRFYLIKGTNSNDPLEQLLVMAHAYLYLKKYEEKQKVSTHDLWNNYNKVIIFLEKYVPVEKDYVWRLKDYLYILKEYVEEYPQVLEYVENQYRE